MNVIKKTVELPDGRTISIETGKLAKQADGAVMLTMGNTMLLATVCAAKDAVPGTDFMPLQVEYKEKFAAFGRFPGGFTKREGRASDYEILTCRLVDRALRPLFPDNYHAEVYVNIILFSADGVDMPDALAGLAASAALAVSDIPFNGPISEVRVARIDGQFVINPTFEQLEKADMDLMVAATYENIMMVEGEMHEVSEAELLEAMKVAHEAIKVHCKAQMELTEEVGKTVKREYDHEVNDEDLRKAVREACYDKAYAVAASGNNNKHERFAAFEAICEEFKAQFSEEELEEKAALIDRYYHDVEKEAMRRSILDEGKRLDGRKTTEIRPIWCEVGYLPGPHGSAIFTRGETQALAVTTLGALGEHQILDGLSLEDEKRFMLHYNFPAFSVGETGRYGAPGRREIGHGALGERCLKQVMPSEEEFPYTVRVVSEILESNGSSSQATICAGCMSLMAAGVPIKAPVAGIAMGLITSKDEKDYTILTDIQGMEDHLGDMDFKVAGTKNGICALQMDIKIDGITKEILQEALAQAKVGRAQIMDCMLGAIPAPRDHLSKYAPKMHVMHIDPEQIRDVIGRGGETINEIIEKSNDVKIDIDQDGTVVIYHSDQEAIDTAVSLIERIVKKAEVGEIYDGTIARVNDNYAFVTLFEGTDGFLHISDWSYERTSKMQDVCKVGDVIKVKVTKVDDKGKVNVSRKALLPKPVKKEEKNEKNEKNEK